MNDPLLDNTIPASLQPILHQFLETARALLPGGATQESYELLESGQAVVSASHESEDASLSRRVLLFGCVDALRAADPRVVDAELRRLVQNVHVPIGEAVAFQWRDGAIAPFTGGSVLPDC